MPRGTLTRPENRRQPPGHFTTRWLSGYCEVKNQREVVGKGNIRHPEPFFSDVLTAQDEIKVPLGLPTRKRGFAIPVHVSQTGGGKKQVDFLFSPQSIEVTSHDMGFPGVFDHLVEGGELLMPDPKSEG